MNPTRLRHITRKYGTPGLLFVGAVIALHSLKQRKPLMLAALGMTALGLFLYLPHSCPTSETKRFNYRIASLSPGQEAPSDTEEETAAYRVVDLGALPGGEISEATAINDRGQVAGVSEVRGENFHAFSWDGKMRDLGTLGGQISIALAINDKNQIAGLSDDRDGKIRGFIQDGGRMRDIGHLGGGLTLASGINNRGGVVGLSVTKDYSGHAFFWQDGKMRDIGTPAGCDLSVAQDVNDSGTVIGVALDTQGRHEWLSDFDNLQTLAAPIFMDRVDPLYAFKTKAYRLLSSISEKEESLHAFAWRNGKFVTLKGKRDTTLASAINNKGQVVGADFSEEDESMRALLWESENGKELPLVAGYTANFASDIADDGAIVGGAFNDEDITACLWKGGKVYDLNKALPSNSGWTLLFANSINSKGQIVGIGIKGDKLRGFLLAPR